MTTNKPEIVAYMRPAFGEVVSKQEHARWERDAFRNLGTDYGNHFKSMALEYSEPLIRLTDHESDRADDKARIAELIGLIDAQRWLLEQCREYLEESNHHYTELNCYMNGSMPASDLVSLSQQGKEKQ